MSYQLIISTNVICYQLIISGQISYVEVQMPMLSNLCAHFPSYYT